MNEPPAATKDLNADMLACAAWIARFLKARGIDRIFGLQGGHIQPIWDHVARQNIRIIDVRDEGAAVHMAHAHAELTGSFGVAMATAGPGVTNTVTAMANASLARAPVLLIGGCTSRPQANMGPLQDIPHVDILRPVTRTSRTLRVAEQVIRELDEAVARAIGDAGEPGPVYVEIPTDVLRTQVPPQLVLDEWLEGKPARQLLPDPAAIAQAVDVFWSARRPLVITGRGARGTSQQLRAARCYRRAISRHARKPRSGARRSSSDRRGGTRGNYDGGRCRTAHRPQTRLPGGVWFAGSFPACALYPPRGQCWRVDRQSAWTARIIGFARTGPCRDDRRGR